jgi:SAM-dependent methyltransferase
MGEGLYSSEELDRVPEIALRFSRGCGNPAGFAQLQSGEVVVDLGCGGGIDTVLAAGHVGSQGRVIGVDFAPKMIEGAIQAVSEAGVSDQVELVVGDMEQLDLADDCVDVVISNCVINLCPDKEAVFREAYRILRPGGRLAISDIILTASIPSPIRERLRASWAGCLGGAVEEDDYFRIVEEAGFSKPEVIARHNLDPAGLRALAGCPGDEFTPAPAEEDVAAADGKVASIKYTALKALS